MYLNRQDKYQSKVIQRVRQEPSYREQDFIQCPQVLCGRFRSELNGLVGIKCF